MTQYLVNQKDIFFILKEQLDYGSLCTLDRYKNLNEKALDMMVNEAIHFAKGVVAPLSDIHDSEGPEFQDGSVTCPREYGRVFKKIGQDGWTAASRSTTYGGQGFPHMMRIVISDFLYSACHSIQMAVSITHGSAHLIETFGTDELKNTFVPNMYNGTWSGTMCLTEPNAGSDLSLIQTTAVQDGDAFKIKGNKQFVSWGEHDIAENIIHLVLARIEGAPEGVKGISLFAVPKFRVNPDGSPGKKNDIICTGIEEKLGIHASPTCSLSFGQHDDCIGYLVGEENKGLSHMFLLMNLSRIGTGVCGMSIANTAYLNTLAYVRERVQGRDIAHRKKGPVPLIDHPDIRRMLLWMKAMSDGMRSLAYSGAFWSDLSLELPPGEEKQHYTNLVDFLTPIIKTYLSETGFQVCETAIQCLGGYGYCKDYPLERYLRDAKILSIYEGTSGIQSMDLMGRKMTINNGGPFLAFISEVEKFCQENHHHPNLGDKIRMLSGVTRRLGQMALEMKHRMASDPLQWASYTYPALLCFGDVAVVWRLLDMAMTADKKLKKNKKNIFYQGKVIQASFVCDTTLPHTLARMETCIRHGREIVEMPVGAF